MNCAYQHFTGTLFYFDSTSVLKDFYNGKSLSLPTITRTGGKQCENTLGAANVYIKEGMGRKGCLPFSNQDDVCPCLCL